MVDDQKGGRYCKIPYHISGDDEGGDKISLSPRPSLNMMKLNHISITC